MIRLGLLASQVLVYKLVPRAGPLARNPVRVHLNRMISRQLTGNRAVTPLSVDVSIAFCDIAAFWE